MDSEAKPWSAIGGRLNGAWNNQYPPLGLPHDKSIHLCNCNCQTTFRGVIWDNNRPGFLHDLRIRHRDAGNLMDRAPRFDDTPMENQNSLFLFDKDFELISKLRITSSFSLLPSCPSSGQQLFSLSSSSLFWASWLSSPSGQFLPNSQLSRLLP
jgi:hypothetical protein